MKVLVTGGCGFIGSHLSASLLSEGHEVHILDNSASPPPGRIKGAKVHIGDIMDKKSVDSATAGCDFVFHEAAQISVQDSIKNPEKTRRINVEGTRNILDECRKHEIKRIILASSAAVYGDAPGLPKKETDTPKPASPYGESKLQNELDAKKYFEEYGLETVCLRYFNVYGSGASTGVIPAFFRSAREKIPPKFYGSGAQTRDFIFVGDVASANILAMRAKGAPGEVFNVGSGRETSLAQLWKEIQSISGCDLEPEILPPQKGDILRSVASIEKAKSRLGFSPKVPLSAGLKKTFEFLQIRK